ncbi:MAG: DUF2318 domain-containing protein [Clostridia bacterium]|nr:DUF2318 domain-containing protein [Clostridia bacterium]
MNRKLFSALSAVAILALTICGAFADDTSGALTIDASSLTDEPAFIDWIQGDTPMQLIALKGADGGVRLAFNTWRSCKGSPWAWFEYLGGGNLQCQNCMQLFPVGIVGTEEAFGCSPITIPAFSGIDGTVVVPEAILAEAEPWFKNWKRTGE